MTGGNDISLIYPWLHVNNSQEDIISWLQAEQDRARADRQPEVGEEERILSKYKSVRRERLGRGVGG